MVPKSIDAARRLTGERRCAPLDGRGDPAMATIRGAAASAVRLDGCSVRSVRWPPNCIHLDACRSSRSVSW